MVSFAEILNNQFSRVVLKQNYVLANRIEQDKGL